MFRDRKNERVWNGNVGASWRDRDRDRDRERDRERDVRVVRDRHWGFNEFRRPNGSFSLTFLRFLAGFDSCVIRGFNKFI